MLDNSAPTKIIAILLLPLVLLAALAAGRNRSTSRRACGQDGEHPWPSGGGRRNGVDSCEAALGAGARACAGRARARGPHHRARRQEPTPRGTPVNVLLDFKVRTRPLCPPAPSASASAIRA